MRIRELAAALAVAASAAEAEGPGLGQPLTADQIPAVATYAMPDGRGLPPGEGTAEQGAELYTRLCASCHGATGAEGPVMPPVGPNELWAKPAGRYWPHATTLFDYIRRAMPFDAPKSLTDDQVYAVTAYILERNGVIRATEPVDAGVLSEIEMPNRDNFIDVWSLQGEKPWE